MRFRMRAALLAVVAAVVVAAACSGGGAGLLAPDYEYEEDLTLSMDGSATLVVNTSITALDALKKMSLNTDVAARSDALRDQLRALYESPYSKVGRINTWTRHGRRFVGIHLTVPDVGALPKAAPFAWALTIWGTALYLLAGLFYVVQVAGIVRAERTAAAAAMTPP